MAEPTLTAVFGSGASQTATTITLDKSDLAAVGLTASASNTAEALLAAIIAKAQMALTQAAFDANLDQSVVVADGFNSIVSRNDGNGNFTPHRQKQFNVNFHSADSSTFDPDNY